MLDGIKGLMKSRKGVLSLLIFFGSLIALFLSKLDSLAFAGIVSTIAVIYNYAQSKTDIASMEK